MKSLAETVVALADLAEAEGRAARQGVLRLILGIGLLIAGVVFGIWGIGLIMSAIHAALATVMHPALAYLIEALVILAIAGGTIIMGLDVAKKKKEVPNGRDRI